MRIAPNSIFSAVTNNIMHNQERFLQLNESIASGKRVHKLSSDPPAVGHILRFRTSIASVEQYQQNVERANSWLTLSEVSLTQVSDALMRAKELALSQASGAVSADSRSTAAVEIDGLLQQTLEAGNAQWGNQFLFAGRKTDTAPFLANGTYQGNSGTLDYEIGQGNFMTVNTPGNVIFGSAGGGVDVIKVLQDLKAALATNDQSGVGSLLNSLDRSLSQVVNARTNVGVKMERLIAQKDQLEEVSNQLTQRLGETEGVDLAKTISDLTHQQYVYEASLAASAKIIQTTLLDFLR